MDPNLRQLQAFVQKPTLAAKELLPGMERTLRDMEEVKSGARGLAKRKRGQVKLGATSAVACTLIPPVLKAYRTSYPNKDRHRGSSARPTCGAGDPGRCGVQYGSPDDQCGQILTDSLIQHRVIRLRFNSTDIIF
jgi:hypothetical protein